MEEENESSHEKKKGIVEVNEPSHEVKLVTPIQHLC